VRGCYAEEAVAVCQLVVWGHPSNRRQSLSYGSFKRTLFRMAEQRRPFEKFVNSPYYSESELCGGVVTVSFFEAPPLASDTLLTTLQPLLENVNGVIRSVHELFKRPS
jgi:hypothetical protein